MKNPALKNYFSVRCVQTIGELWKILHKDKSVFIRSWNRVHPCKFFLNNDLHFTIKRLEEMIENREFYQVVSKKGAGIQSFGEYIKRSSALICMATGIPPQYLTQNPNTCA